ncbi:MAG: bis(5'-nucleosidyl)-tetraphosphatase [Candidatus Omnitrophota bacterium]|jgi:bis(5'-nucleosidyl)-tetraphosphatase
MNQTPPLSDESFGIIAISKATNPTKYLLVQHLAGHWGFPKGHAEAGESPVQSAAREFLEETGIKPSEFDEKNFLEETYEFTRAGKTICKKVRYYLMFIDETQIFKQEEELSAADWLTYDEASTKITFSEAQQILNQARAAIA